MQLLSINSPPVGLVCLIAVIFCGSFLIPQPNRRNTNSNAKSAFGDERRPHQQLLGQARRLVNETSEDVIRRGRCSNVPYGSLVWDNEVDIKNLPLNELMIHLDRPAYVSPPNQYGVEYGPVIVDIGLYLISIGDVDFSAGTFFMEGFLDMVWCDTRVAFDSSSREKHIYLEESAAHELEIIWWPDVTFVNEIGKRTIENEELIIESDGTVEYREKFSVTLHNKYAMEEFPFDSQVLVAEIESFAWNSSVLQFHVEENLVGFSEEFEIPNFHKEGIDEHIEIKKEARDRYPFSDLVTEFTIKRDPTYYVTKVFIPLSLIVVVSWAVFWMESTDIGDRMSIVITGVLTAVAYQFVVADSLPPHITNTFVDNFVLMCFFLLVLSGILNVAINYLSVRGKRDEAIFLDVLCRFLFPFVFLLGTGILYGMQFRSHYNPGGATLVITMLVLLLVLIISKYAAFKLRRDVAKHKLDRSNHGEIEDEGLAEF